MIGHGSDNYDDQKNYTEADDGADLGLRPKNLDFFPLTFNASYGHWFWCPYNANV